MTQEIWRPVPTEPDYFVSNLGRVRGRRGKIIRGGIQPNGYIEVTVDSRRCKNGKRNPRRRSLASMILEAFRGPRPSRRHQSRHLNDKKPDNRLANLAWGLPLDNAKDRCRNGTAYRPIGVLHHQAKLTNAKVRALRRVYKRYGKVHIALANKFGITGSTARAICKRKSWPHVK